MNNTILEKQKAEYNLAVTMKRDAWVPACGGTETVFTVRNKRVLYVYNPKQHLHRYLDVDSDMVMEDEDYFSFIS